MTLRSILLLLCLALLIGGSELLYQSTAMPEWTDENKAMSVMTWDPPQQMSGPGFDAYYRRWADELKAVRTEKWPYHDAGAAFVAFAVSLAAALFLLRINTDTDIKRLLTPKHRWAVWAIGALAWLGYMASAILALLEGFDRSEFPNWGDSLIVPVTGIVVITVVGWILYSLVAWFVLRRAELPVNLWIWRKDLPVHNSIATGAAAVSILIALELMRETYLYGHWLAVPALFLWVYTALAFRAAFISKI